MPSHKNAHYVPKFILENFAAEDGLLWACRKDTEKGNLKCFRSKPKGLFVRVRHYKQPDGLGGDSRNNTEHKLAKLEHETAPIIKKIKLKVRKKSKRKHICLHPDERYKLEMFLFSLSIRTPDLISKGLELGHEIASDEEIEFFEDRAVLVETMLDNRDKHSVTKLYSESHHKVYGKPIFDIKLGITIGFTDNKGLIIGSMPIAKTNLIRGIWHPISPNIALALNIIGKEEIIEFTQEQIDEINANIFNSSELVAASSEELLLSVILLCKLSQFT